MRILDDALNKASIYVVEHLKMSLALALYISSRLQSGVFRSPLCTSTTDSEMVKSQ